MERDAIARTVELLTVDDFYRELHKKIYRAILELWDKGEPVNVVTVTGKLLRAGQLEQCGSVDYLLSLVEACPNPHKAEAYARNVREKSILRQRLL